jgi:GNAT superfamily N-acetyltransferase
MPISALWTSTPWTDDDVLDAAAEWSWEPEGSRVLDGELYVIQRPAWVRGHVSVERVASSRPAAELVDEAAARAQEWGDDALEWAVSDRDDPTIASELERRGAAVIEQLDVLALPLAGADAAAPDVAPGVEVHRVETRADVAAIGAINAAVWRNAPLDDDRTAQVLREVRQAIAERTGYRVVASVDGRPVSVGGVTLAPGPRGTVARLWGAATLEDARGRGAYRAVLAERLRLAAEAGATLALVKGRTATSAPILTRAGFRRCGGESRFRLPL